MLFDFVRDAMSNRANSAVAEKQALYKEVLCNHYYHYIIIIIIIN